MRNWLIATLLLVPGCAVDAPADPPESDAREPSPAPPSRHWAARQVVGGNYEYLSDGAQYGLQADRRMASAFLLAGDNSPDTRAILQSLLSDPDVLVRFTAAESLFGSRAQSDAMASKYRYASVLSAGQAVAALAAEIRDSDMKAQYDATRRLIALGRPACRALAEMASGRDALNMSASFAIQEITSRHQNLPPAWALEVEKKLDVALGEIELDGMLAADALQHLSELSGVTVVLDDYLRDPPKEFAGRFTDCSLRSILATLCGTHDLRFVMHEGGVAIAHLENLWDGGVPILLDVRDLVAAGFAPDWHGVVKDAYPGDEYSLAFSLYPGMSIHRDGFLDLMATANGSDPDGRLHAAPLARHLDRLRSRRGLPLAGGVWPEWPEADEPE